MSNQYSYSELHQEQDRNNFEGFVATCRFFFRPNAMLCFFVVRMTIALQWPFRAVYKDQQIAENSFSRNPGVYWREKGVWWCGAGAQKVQERKAGTIVPRLDVSRVKQGGEEDGSSVGRVQLSGESRSPLATFGSLCFFKRYFKAWERTNGCSSPQESLVQLPYVVFYF